MEKKIEKNKKLWIICGVLLLVTGLWLFLMSSAELYWFLTENSGYHAIDHYVEYIGESGELLKSFSSLVKTGAVLSVIATLLVVIVAVMFLKRRNSATIKSCTVMEILLAVCVTAILFDVMILFCLGGFREIGLGSIFLCFDVFLLFCLCVCVHTKVLLKNINAKKRTVLE